MDWWIDGLMDWWIDGLMEVEDEVPYTMSVDDNIIILFFVVVFVKQTRLSGVR